MRPRHFSLTSSSCAVDFSQVYGDLCEVLILSVSTTATSVELEQKPPHIVDLNRRLDLGEEEEEMESLYIFSRNKQKEKCEFSDLIKR